MHVVGRAEIRISSNSTPRRYNPFMPSPLTRRFTLQDLRAARQSAGRVAMLTCYDFTTAQLMQRAGVPSLLVGDSAASVILGHESTLPVSLDFMIELTAAVRRGAPLALLIGDMPFGSYQGSVGQGVNNVCRMVKLSGCDGVKLEVAEGHLKLVRRLADAGVAIVAHLGLRPQAVGLLGGYRYQGRTADEAMRIVTLAQRMEKAGAAALLLEAVPAVVAKAVVDRTTLPVIGCGAGKHCHGSVVVTPDLLGWTARKPRFVPDLGDPGRPIDEIFGEYVRRINEKLYPADEHDYEMPSDQQADFAARLKG
jgi:3-methyl-2-oxobutanoate hydroxymethyltransferase